MLKPGKRLLSARQVDHLPCDHAVRAAAARENARAFRQHAVRQVCRQQHPKRLRLQRVAGKRCHRHAVNHVVRRLAAAQRIVVHAGQIVVDQRIGMHHFQRAGKRQRSEVVQPAQTRKFQRQHRAQPLSAGEQAVAHGFIELRAALLSVQKKTAQILLSRGTVLPVALFKKLFVHSLPL